MTSEAQKWHDHFAQCEAEQLLRSPLRELVSPLERAQYDVALNYLSTELRRSKSSASERIVAFLADEPTRHAFFDRVRQNKGTWFCLRFEERDAVFKGRRRGNGVWPFREHYHGFSNCSQMKPDDFSRSLGKDFEELEPSDVFVRRFGSRDASRAGCGGSDFWYWNGTTFTRLNGPGSRWVS